MTRDHRSGFQWTSSFHPSVLCSSKDGYIGLATCMRPSCSHTYFELLLKAQDPYNGSSSLGLSVMKIAFLLAAIAAPFVVLAVSREVVRGPSLRARSGIDTSTIAKECQSQCTSIINTLEVCTPFFPVQPISLKHRCSNFWVPSSLERLAMAALNANAHKRSLMISGPA